MDPANGTIGAAAAAVGISDRTASRWLADDDFRQDLRQAEAEAVSSAVRRLSALSAVAVDVLAEVMAETDTGHRRHAAKVVLDTLMRLRSETEFEDRLTAVEDRIANGKS